MDDRDEKLINNFLNEIFAGAEFKISALAGDASSRKYFRVIKNPQIKPESFVLMYWEPFKVKDYPFLSVLQHFKKHSVNVPNVVGLSESNGLVLLEDLGDLTLERKFWESQDEQQSLGFYQQAIDELIKIHFLATFDRTDCTAFNLQFDTEKLLWEMNYGLENLIFGICDWKTSDANKKEIISCMKSICDQISSEPKVIVHRDYHSRNLMIKFDQMRVIDFQDARLGAIQYDLVSLMRDSYVNISDEMQKTLIQDYLIKALPYLDKVYNRKVSDEEFMNLYELQTVQRCFKACGSFASFYNQRQDKRYLKYISHTLKRVLKSATLFSECQPLVNALIDSGSLDRKYDTL